MARILVVFGTTHDHTRKIAEFIAEQLRLLDHHVDVCDSSCLPGTYHLDLYDGFIGGASVHISHFQRAFRNWIRLNANELNGKPSVFFAVCLGILQKDPSVQEAERKIVRDFLAETGWKPNFVSIFAGALAYTQYNWILKRLMRRIALKAGVATDTSHDYEYTDWSAVKDLATTFASSFTSVPGVAAAPSQR